VQTTGSPAVLTVLGSGTLLPDAARCSAAFHLEVQGRGILLDCGTGTLHGLARWGVAWRDIDLVAISHYHTDHVGDLAALLAALKFSGRARPLTLIGPLGFRDFLGRLAAAFGAYVLDPGFDVRVVELSESDHWNGDWIGTSVRCCPTPHTEESVAFRVVGTWGSLGYTGDTGPSTDVADFLAGCVVIVAECALGDPPDLGTHLSPRTVASLAQRAVPKLLVLSHVYPPQTPDDALARVKESYEGEAVVARDGLRMSLASGDVVLESGTRRTRR